MSARRMLVLPTRSLLKHESCLFCQSRQFFEPIRRHASTQPTSSSSWNRRVPVSHTSASYYSTERKTPQQVRAEIDKRARKGYYTMMRKEGIIVMDPSIGDDIYTDFVDATESSTEYATIVSELAQQYKIKVADITSLAMATFKIPDIAEPRRRLPPSQHKAISGLLLQGCARARDPLAVIHILTAVHLSNSGTRSGTVSAARETSRLFSPSERSHFTQILAELAAEGNVEAMTLRGQFLEKEGKKQQAKELYEKALDKTSYEFDPKGAHAMAFPRTSPWNALGFLLKEEKDPKAGELARKAFEKGALKGDDPIAYFELSSYEKDTAKWLQYTTKAASSGHPEAMYNLGNFYMQLNSNASLGTKDNKMNQALNWLTSWKPGSAASHALEWFDLAASRGHKPSMLELAEFYNMEGEVEKAIEYWKMILEAPFADSMEEWPLLVKKAKERLTNVRA